MVGRDAKAGGKQDTFMLNDTTLAWGKDHGNGQIDIAATQTLPGVGPIDKGESMINIAEAAHADDGGDSMGRGCWVVGWPDCGRRARRLRQDVAAGEARSRRHR